MKRRQKSAGSRDVRQPGLYTGDRCDAGSVPRDTGTWTEGNHETSLGLLVTGFGHDFNNLLNEIAGNLYLASAKAHSPSDVRRYLWEAERAAYLAKDLVTQLTALALPGAVVRRRIDLEKVLPGWVDRSLKGTGTALAIEIGEGVRPVCANEEQLRQVVHQIVRNAAEAMNGGGTVTISLTGAAPPRVDGVLCGNPREVVVSVSDEGPGIPGENLKRIFDPYFTTKESADQRGLGLGLAMCQAIVARHGGRITADSEVGKGTCFRITLPCTEPEERAAPGPVAPQGGRKGRVLVMDDEELDRAVAGAVLSHLSYEAQFAKNGEEAIDLYMYAKAKGEGFDVVIMDLVVPGGLGGKETFRRLREIDPGVRAVLSSGYHDPSSHSQLTEEGFSAVLPKPYGVEDLKKLLEALCRNK